MGYTWDDIYDELKVPYGGLPGRSTQDMLQLFWEAAGYVDGDLGADAKVAFYISQGAIGDTLGDLEHDYWHRVGANLLAAKGAVFAIDATQSVDGEQWVLNRGSGGQVLRAKYGSVARSEIRRGVGLVMPGVTGNRASIPNTASLIPANLEVRATISADSYGSTGMYRMIAGPGWDLAGNQGWFFGLAAIGGLGLYFSTDGTNVVGYETTSLAGAGASGTIDVMATRPSSTGLVSLFWRPAASSLLSDVGWSLLGSNVVSAGLSPFVSTAAFYMGGTFGGTTSPFVGSVRAVILKDNIGGTTVLDVDFTTQPDLTTSFTATTGQTVTVTAANAVDTNDPLWLNHTGENYLHVPAVGGNVAQVPDSAALDITGDIEVVCRATAPPDTAATSRIFMNKSNSVSSEYSWNFETYAGNLYFIVTSGGTSATQQFGQAVIPVPLGLVYWWKATFNAALGRVQFFYAPDSPTEPTSWTAITNVRADFGAFTIYAGTAPLGVGASGTGGNNLSGNMYRAIIRNGIGGTTVFDANFTTNTQQTSFVCSTGQTISLIRSSVGRKLVMVTRPVWLFGTDDYLEIADNDLLDFGASDAMTMVVVHRSWSTPPPAGAFLAKKHTNGAGSAGYALHVETANLYFSPSDGTIYPHTGFGQPFDSGILQVLAGVRDVAADRNRIYVNNATQSTSDGTTATWENAVSLFVGKWNSGSFMDMELLAVGIFRRALSAAEIAQIATYYGAA